MDPHRIIDALHLRPHPEGGWYGETWRALPVGPGQRPTGSAIYFLLRAGETSGWHRVDATEIWLFHAGAPLELRTASSDGSSTVAVGVLGVDLGAGQLPQIVVPAGDWQTARSLGDWTLVGCSVSPAFSFDGFELAPPGWQPGNRLSTK